MERGCWTCGGTLPQRKPGPGRRRRYCTAVCASRAKRLRHPAPVRVTTPCPQCGGEVKQLHRPGPARTYCGGECKRMAYSGGVTPVYRTAAAKRTVFQQSDWTCGICTEPIDPDAQYPDVRSATVDHVIPLSQGGADDLSNLQAAHFICNIRKRSPSLQGGGSDARTTEGPDRAASTQGALAGP